MKISIEDMIVRTGTVVAVCGFLMILAEDCSSRVLGYSAALLFFSGVLMMHFGLKKIEEK